MRHGARDKRRGSGVGKSKPVMVAAAAAAVETLESRRMLAADVVISEFLASNDNSILDSFGNHEDWIEIHNAGDAAANLNDFYLTDSAATPTKWRFPNQMIAPGEYLVVFASNRNLAVAGQELHTNFALGAGGEYLGLIRASDLSAQFEYAPTFPPQSTDVSYGLFNSDDRNSARISFPIPSPGVANVPTATGALFSQPGKAFTGTLPVELSSPTPGAQIYYTTNNSAPTTASTPYTAPINLSATTVIRAIVAAPGYANSLITSQSYIAVDGTVSSFSSNLPIVVLDSFGQPMDDQTYRNSTAMFIETGADGRADMLDPVNFAGRIGLRYRGSTSFFNYPKKQFAVETRGENDDDKSVSLLGLPAESDWTLYAPWTEKPLMNNELAMRWAREMGRYSSRTRWVEVYHNIDNDPAINFADDYVGVFMLMEKPKIDENRINIAKPNPTVVDGGFLFKKDRKETQEIAITTTGGAFVPAQTFVMVDPDETEITTDQTNFLLNYMNEFEAVLNGPNFADPVNGYAKYIDVDSFIDFYLHAEFTKSVDSFWLSTFFYKDAGGKVVAGPYWDFNLAFGMANYRNGASASGWNHDSLTAAQYGYFARLFQDPNFVTRMTDRWQELRKTVLATPKMLADIDANVEALTDNNGDYPVGPGAPTQPSTNPAIRNFKKWPVLGTYSTTNSYFDPQGRWIKDVEMMKSWVAARAQWMDSQFVAAPLVTPPGGTITGTTNVTITPRAQASGVDTVLLGPGAPAKAIVPSGNISGWQLPGFSDAVWPLSGNTGVGYDTTATPVNYLPQVGLNVGSMQNVRTSVFIRIPFNIPDPSAVGSLILKMKYDDGFFAWVNGVRVIEAGAPENVNPVFTTAATAARDENAALQYVEFDISSVKPLLVAGTNVLAIQGMNNVVGSNDLLMVPEIVSRQYTNATAGSVYYTTDGSDPRTPSGGISAAAQLYAGAIAVSSNTRLRARTLHSGGVWSGIADEVYELAAGELRVTELMYNPSAPPPGGAFPQQDFEWIEIKNAGAGPLNLNGLAFTVGVTYTLPNVTLAPGDYAVIAKNVAAFQSRYPSVPAGKILAGVFGGSLDNGGETLTVAEIATGTIVHSFTYDDIWYPQTDGDGYSLVIRDPQGDEANWDAAGAWRSSEQPQGLPAADDTDTSTPTLISATFNPAAKTVAYVFSEPVTLTVAPGAGLSVTDLLTSTSITPTSTGVATKTVTVTLPAGLGNGIYAAAFTAPSISDFAGHALAAAAAHAFLYVGGGQTLLVPATSSTYLVNQLEMGAGATLDLKDNSLAIDYASASPLGTHTAAGYSGIAGLIQSARGVNGTWDGVGITTSLPAAVAGITGIGVGEVAALRGISGSETTTWDGQRVDATTLIVKYTYAGDANLDGVIDGGDYGLIDNFVQVPSAWGYGNGDFNFDGVIDGGDYGIIDNNIQAQGLPL